MSFQILFFHNRCTEAAYKANRFTTLPYYPSTNMYFSFQCELNSWLALFSHFHFSASFGNTLIIADITADICNETWQGNRWTRNFWPYILYSPKHSIFICKLFAVHISLWLSMTYMLSRSNKLTIYYDTVANWLNAYFIKHSLWVSTGALRWLLYRTHQQDRLHNCLASSVDAQ